MKLCPQSSDIWHVSPEQRRGCLRPKLQATLRGGRQPAFTSVITSRAIRPGESSYAFENYNEFEPRGIRQDFALLKARPALGRKIAAGGQERSVAGPVTSTDTA